MKTERNRHTHRLVACAEKKASRPVVRAAAGGLRGIKKRKRGDGPEFFSSARSPGRWQKDTPAKQMFSRDVK